jgi:GAF domain-containing protein
MEIAPIPKDEVDRLAALRALLILDTPPEERFDRIAAFAAQEFDVPIALVSLVDADRTWFKAHIGVDLCEAPRDISFCGHAIVSDETLVVPDALLDTRFADNPHVVNPPHIRFYAGACLQMPSGQIVGTLCLHDMIPRVMDAISLAILSSLRDLVVEELVAKETT